MSADAEKIHAMVAALQRRFDQQELPWQASWTGSYGDSTFIATPISGGAPCLLERVKRDESITPIEVQHGLRS